MISEGGSFAVVEDGVFSDICAGCPWNVLFDDLIFTFSFAINLSQHLQGFENDLEILVSRFLFRMSFVFYCLIWLQIPHVIVGVYQYSLLRLR